MADVTYGSDADHIFANCAAPLELWERASVDAMGRIALARDR
jgi:hypothetical protein